MKDLKEGQGIFLVRTGNKGHDLCVFLDWKSTAMKIFGPTEEI